MHDHIYRALHACLHTRWLVRQEAYSCTCSMQRQSDAAGRAFLGLLVHSLADGELMEAPYFP